MRGRWFVVLLTVIAGGSLAAAEVRGRMALDAYTATEGLANDAVMSMLVDSRGFLWFGTLDGVSRFDGESFVTYDVRHGLPDRRVGSLAEDRSGALWIGTGSGVARMAPDAAGSKIFETFTVAPGVPVAAGLIYAGRDGTIYSSCDGDLCRVERDRLVVDGSLRAAGARNPRALAHAADGTLWAGTESGLYRRSPGGGWKHVAVQPDRGSDTIEALHVDAAGRIWITNGFGLIIYAPDGSDDPRPLAERSIALFHPGDTLRLPERGEAVRVAPRTSNPVVLFRPPLFARDGTFWQPSYAGLLRIRNGRIDWFDRADGLPIDMTAVAEDPAGHLWLGSRSSGAWRLARPGMRTFTAAHGLATERIRTLFELPDGSVCALVDLGVSCFRGDRTAHGTLWPRNMQYRGWGWNQTVARASDGSTWIASGEGVVRHERLDRLEDLGNATQPTLVTTRDGLDADDVFRVWIDSRGTLWVGTFGTKPLSTRAAGDARFESFGVAEGFPHAAPTAFAEDRAGNVWIGLYTGGVVRVREGRFELIRAGVPHGFVRDLWIDSAGRLWIATSTGVAIVDDPAATASGLRIRALGVQEGLTSGSGYALAELPDGRMAIGSQRGLYILDATTRRSVRVTVRDGLPSNEVTVLLSDREGALWVGTVSGLARIERIPPARATPPPRPLVESIRIDGGEDTVGELGTAAAQKVLVAWPNQRLAIGFVAPYFDNAAPLRYEYRLAGSDWVDAGPQRAVLFDHLPRGSRLLELRAVNQHGLASPATTITLVVVPPFWQRAWFLASLAAVTIGSALAIHRVRLQRLLELERMRTRVATDLHDDLGSSLSRISILSEAAKDRPPHESAPLLDEIAESARSLVDALGDTIWSMDPRHDDGHSLFLRIRRFASPLFEARNIDLDLDVAPEAAATHLDPEPRRQTYLILKEALNNAARHAGATRVAIAATADADALTIRIRDDGRGFVAPPPVADHGGRGLASMRDRAARMGGRLEIRTSRDSGTTVVVIVPR